VPLATVPPAFANPWTLALPPFAFTVVELNELKEEGAHAPDCVPIKTAYELPGVTEKLFV
jgi:hypothetical protein